MGREPSGIWRASIWDSIGLRFYGEWLCLITSKPFIFREQGFHGVDASLQVPKLESCSFLHWISSIMSMVWLLRYISKLLVGLVGIWTDITIWEIIVSLNVIQYALQSWFVSGTRVTAFRVYY